MNAGKSSLMNLLTQQECSITDSTPGTTTDTKLSFMELHGLGPIKLFDTAGFDENNTLGAKKRQKVIANLKECDLILLVINPASNDVSTETKIIELARNFDKQLLVLYNIFKEQDKTGIAAIENEIQDLKYYKHLGLCALSHLERPKLIDFIINNYEPKNVSLELLPFLEPNEYYILNIPMDEETPTGRYLRPQSMCAEYITRHWAYPVSYRMDLNLARQNDMEEHKRFDDFLMNFKQKPSAFITDSQAIDIVYKWLPADIPVTTFSIVMIQYISRGRLRNFVNGVRQLDQLKAGDKVLIVEACNHSRNHKDIGTIQIPKQLKKLQNDLVIDFNFGREFQDNRQLEEYQLVIHCGACMITQQKLIARLRDLDTLSIPYTNYGILLSYFQGAETLPRVTKLWEPALEPELVQNIY